MKDHEPIIFLIQNAQISSKKKEKHKSTRPDITHQCLLTLLDSPLNKAGKLKIFIHTTENILIEVNPAIRVPRTPSRFNGLISQLLMKHKIKALSGEILLKVIKNPLSMHVKPNLIWVMLCKDGIKMEKNELRKGLERGYLFFVNAIARGEDKGEECEMRMKVSDFGLSAAIACGKVCNIFEEIYSIF